TQSSVQTVQHETEFSRVGITGLSQDLREQHSGGGLFLERAVEDIREIAPSLQDKDQTVSYFGFTKKELIRFIDAMQSRGVDRIVPVGQALDFNGVWDGYRLLHYFTREITIL
ncbi:MAG TPA: acyl-CoA reductase, partial [Bacillales bacterium]